MATDNNEILLKGLVGSNPLGMLAATGLLRVCNEIPELAVSRLGWRMEDDWFAALTVPKGTDKDNLIDLIVRWLRNWSKEVIEWNDDIYSEPVGYKKRMIESMQSASKEYRLIADFFTAFGSETVTAKKHLIKPTAFHMTSGQQKFLNIIQKIDDSLRNGDVESAFREALFSQWRYEDSFHSLGWDPAAERMYALRYRAPTRDKPRCVRGAIWLGFQALPLFPTVRRNSRLITNNFITNNYTFSKKEISLIWPIWTRPLTLDGLRSLLHCSELASDKTGWERLCRRGVAAVYRSVRSEFGRGYATLRPATLVYLAAGELG